MPYNKAGTGSKLFAATDAAIYDATSAGTVGAAVVSSLTGGKWQHVMFTNSAGQYLIAVNGADILQYYNGSAWATTSVFGSLSTADLVDVTVFQQRLFFVKKNSMEVHYLATGAISGTATPLYFGQLFKRGGSVIGVGTWTIDGGSGTDDHLVIITSEGELAVYGGYDPSGPTTWTLRGVYFIGRPIGRRCHTKYGGDMLLLTDRGLFPLSKALQSASVDKTIAFTDKVEPSFIYQSSTLFNTFGWELCVNTNDSFLVVNIPATSGSIQYVMHLQTLGWSDFTGWNASCWAYFGGALYYGTSEKVVKAYSGSSDFGSNIVADIVPAFNYWGDRGQQKHIKLLRPTFTSDGPITYALEGCTDFTLVEPTNVVTPAPVSAALWGIALWGIGVWSGGITVTREWQTVFNNNHSAFAPYIRIATNTVQSSLLSIDYTIEVGGIL